MDLLTFYKTFSHPDRLIIAGILAQHPATLDELRIQSGLTQDTITRHLTVLFDSHLISRIETAGQQRLTLNKKALEQMNRQILGKAGETKSLSPEEKALAPFMNDDGTIREIPAKHSKKLLLLEWLLQKFDSDRDYTEKEINETILNYHHDTAYLRRSLVEFEYMHREKGIYWRLK